MHPVLFHIPLPHGSVPLGPALFVLAVVALVIAELGRRSRAPDLVLLGLGGALASLVFAVRSHGESISFGPVPLYGFGALLCAGLFGGWFLTLSLAKRDGLSVDVVAGCYFAAAVSGLLGARVLYVLTNLGDFRSLSDVLAFRSGGLVFYGGILGGLVGSIAYLRGKSVSWFSWADVAAPSLALGSCMGRIGCYLAGCDYGLPLSANAPRWLVRLGTFPRWPDEVAGPGAGSPAWVDQVLYRGLSPDSTASLAVHPTQLYEALAGAALLGWLVWFGPRRAFRGQVFFAYTAGYAALRFVLEVLRDDPERGSFGPVLPLRFLVMAGLFVMAFAFVAGPSRAFSASRRFAVRGAALCLPLGAFAYLRNGYGYSAAFSTSQWIALGSSVAVAVVWRRLAPGGRGTPGEALPAASSG